MSNFRQFLPGAVAAVLLAACGGGGSAETTAMAPVTLVADGAPRHVRVEGCVVDATDHPLALPVHALARDGRLLASALAGDDGVFHLHVPAHDSVTLAAAAPGATPVTVMTGGGDFTVAACLRPALA